MVLHISSVLGLICIFFFFYLFFQREHYLVVLLILELITMVLILGLPMVGLLLSGASSPLVMVLLVMGACEASVGLSIMVYLVRSHGNDLMSSTAVGSL